MTKVNIKEDIRDKELYITDEYTKGIVEKGGTPKYKYKNIIGISGGEDIVIESNDKLITTDRFGYIYFFNEKKDDDIVLTVKETYFTFSRLNIEVQK